MTCYIYRDDVKELIGPFRSPDDAMTHREEAADELRGVRGHPKPVRRIGIIITVEEAIKLAMSGCRRMTPEQDYYETDRDETECAA